MGVVCLHDKEVIEVLLERDPYLHIYCLGDLDDMLWPSTTWYGYHSGEELKTVVLVYSGPGLPTVIGISGDREDMRKHLSSIQQLLPAKYYAHVNLGLEKVFLENGKEVSGRLHHKMGLRDAGGLSGVDTRAVARLGEEDLPALQALYDECYPGNWFDPHMLRTSQYFGIKEASTIIAAAGVHVYSQRYRVAALGNIITETTHRNRGYGTKVTAALCKSLAALGLRIGLNVQADNLAAIASYKKLGFQKIAEYGEYLIS